MTFKIGDRAIVNDTFDELVPDRENYIGTVGTVTDQVPEQPECLWFTPDDPRKLGMFGVWAVMDSELDKLED